MSGGCALDTVPGDCLHPVVCGQVQGRFIYRNCDGYPCAACPRDTIFLCGEGVQQCSRCAHIAVALCDFPLGGGTTCDLPLCDGHRIAQGGDMQDIDYCPQHALMACVQQQEVTS
jgi:hypothetical protein